MSRYPSLAIAIASTVAPVATLATTLVASPPVAHAQSQAELAEKLNEEGKELMYQNKYAEASYKFQQAVARVAEPKYFFNLCVSQTNEGKLNEAYANCISAKGNANSDLVGKSDKMITKIQDLAKQQNVELQEPGGAAGRDPTPPDRTNGNPPPDRTNGNPPANDMHAPPPTRVSSADGPPTGGSVRYAPPPENLAFGRVPDHSSAWAPGIALLGGGGQVGEKNAYGRAAGGFRLKSDVLFDPIHRVGAEGYIQYNHLGGGSPQAESTGVSTLDIVDVGAALYKHFCLGGRLCVTPLIGAHLSLMSPADQQDAEGSQLFNYAAVGGRGGIALAYAFG